MAAAGDFSLIDFLPFLEVANYESCWFRDQIAKNFKSKDAMTFVFESKPLSIDISNECIKVRANENSKLEILYPPRYEHHLSVWIISDNWKDDELFKFAHLFLTSAILVSINLLSTYVNDSSQQGRVYKMIYQSYRGALSKDRSNCLQNLFRAKLEVDFSDRLTLR